MDGTTPADNSGSRWEVVGVFLRIGALGYGAAAIWELCDGTRTVEEISRELGRWLGRPGEALFPDVRQGLARLSELGLLEAR